MARPDYPQIQGFYPSWADADFRLAGINVADIKSLKWEATVEVQDVMGAGAIKKGTTRGVVKYGAVTAEIYEDAADKLGETLARKSSDGKSITLVQFTGGIQWERKDGSISRRVFTGLRVVKGSEDWKQGTDASVVNVEMNVMQIVNVSNGMRYGLLLSNG